MLTRRDSDVTGSHWFFIGAGVLLLLQFSGYSAVAVENHREKILILNADAGGGYFLRLLNSRNGDSGEGAVLGIDHLARRRIGRYGLIAKSPLPDDAVRHRLTIAEDRRLQKQLVALWIEVEFFNDSNAIAGIFQRNVGAVPLNRKICRRNLVIELGIQGCNGKWPAQFCRTCRVDKFNGLSFSVGVRSF